MKLKKFFAVCIFVGLSGLSVGAQVDEPASPSEKNPKALELIKRAVALEDGIMLESAIDTYKEVLKLEPKDFAAMNTIAGLYGKLGEAKEETVWAQRAIDTSPKFWKAYINLGNGLAIQGKFELAIVAYKKAAELAPKDPLPLYSLGVVEENREKFAEALALYKRAIELDPKFEAGLFNAAAMHANLKQFTEAKKLLSTLLEINPNDRDAKQMLQAIEREKPE
jgi:tetratricopeptide (TPR) repeat protein